MKLASTSRHRNKNNRVYIFADTDGDGSLHAFKSLKDADDAYRGATNEEKCRQTSPDFFKLRLYGDFVTEVDPESVWVIATKFCGCYNTVHGVYSSRLDAETKAKSYVTDGDDDEEVTVEMVKIIPPEVEFSLL